MEACLIFYSFHPLLDSTIACLPLQSLIQIIRSLEKLFLRLDYTL